MTLANQILCLIAFAVVSLYLLRVSLRRAAPEASVVDYFLAGGAVGAGATLRNNLGANWALANSIWFYLVVGQQNGILAALVLQVFWAIGIALVGAKLVPAIIHATSKGHTLHGFLGAFYGSSALRTVFASLACLYYLLLFAFEIVVGANIIAAQLNPDPRLAVVLAAAMATLPAIYISVSGFKGNVAGDRMQNRLGVASLVAFSIGVAVWFLTTRPMSGISSLVSPGAKLFDIGNERLLGLIVVNSVLNFVDVGNWQTVAANIRLAGPSPEKIEAALHVKLGRPWYVTAIAVMFIPALLCAWIGSTMQTQELTDQQLFPALFATFIPSLNVAAQAFLLPLILAGFLLLSIGFAENVLSAAQLILVADILRPKQFDAIRSSFDPTGPRMPNTPFEERFLQFTRRVTLLVIALSAVLIAGLAWLRAGESTSLSDGLADLWWALFVFLPTMVCMTCPVLYACWCLKKGIVRGHARATLGAFAVAATAVVITIVGFRYESLNEVAAAIALPVSTAAFFLMFLIPEHTARRLVNRGVGQSAL